MSIKNEIDSKAILEQVEKWDTIMELVFSDSVMSLNHLFSKITEATQEIPDLDTQLIVKELYEKHNNIK